MNLDPLLPFVDVNHRNNGRRHIHQGPFHHALHPLHSVVALGKIRYLDGVSAACHVHGREHCAPVVASLGGHHSFAVGSPCGDAVRSSGARARDKAAFREERRDGLCKRCRRCDCRLRCYNSFLCCKPYRSRNRSELE